MTTTIPPAIPESTKCEPPPTDRELRMAKAFRRALLGLVRAIEEEYQIGRS